jgi:predicted Zn-dependent protease
MAAGAAALGLPVPASARENRGLKESLSAMEEGVYGSRHDPERYDLSRIRERGVGRGLNFYSPAKERALGQELAHRLDENDRLLQDPAIDAYLARIAHRLVKTSDAQPPLTIKVVLDDNVNAVTLPGGFIYVNSGAILAAANEAQLAAVIAHEIAHVESRHTTRNSSKQGLVDGALTPTHFLPGPVAYVLQKLRPMLLLRIRRNSEREADLLGMEYQYAAGYDVREFPAFLEKVQREDGESTCAGMAFPTCRDRVRNIELGAKKFLPQRQQSIVNTAEFNEVRTRLVGLTSQQ